MNRADFLRAAGLLGVAAFVAPGELRGGKPRSLADAIAAAGPGDAVVVPPGVYDLHEPLVIPEGQRWYVTGSTFRFHGLADDESMVVFEGTPAPGTVFTHNVLMHTGRAWPGIRLAG